MSKRRLVQIVISATLLLLVTSLVDLGQVQRSLSAADPTFLVLSLLVGTADRAFMPIKWMVLLRAQNIRLPWLQAIKIYYTSTFLGLFLPATVGADAVRAYMVARSFPLANVVTSIVIERLIGQIALLLFAAVGAFVFLTTWGTVGFDAARLLWITVMLLILGTAVGILSLSGPFSNAAAKLLVRARGAKHFTRVSGGLERMYRSYELYRERKGALAFFLVLCIAENFLPVVRVYLIGLALHTQVPLSYFFVCIPVMLLLIRLPLSLDGFGIHEGTIVYFLSLVGVSQSVAFSVGLTSHFLFLVALLPGAVLYFLVPDYRKVARQSATG